MKKVLLIGWDAADWKVIQPLMDAGQMPALQALVDHGSMGNITTLQPVLSPMLWTSIATGKRPYKHGIHGFTEPDPSGAGIRPITNLSRKTKTLWNILNQQGLRSNVVGWWPSHPAEPINGVMVSDQYHKAPRQPDQPWPLPPGCIHPERLAAPLAELRVHPAELVDAQLLPFVPQLADIDPEKDKRIISVAKTLAEAATVQSAATYLATEEPWDFMAVYFDAIDHFGHGFMKYHPPRQDWVPKQDYELYKGVIDAGYRFHDLMLQGLLNLVDLRETVVMLVSDHGFHPDHLRPSAIPTEPAGPAVEHREHGIFLACGPGIRQDQLIHGAGLLDIAPTVLSLYGLPVGEDMDGSPLTDIFETPPRVSSIPSWDAVDGDSGEHPPEKQLDPEEARAAVDQLVELGYIDKPAEDQQQAVKQTVRELHYNLAQSLMDAGRHGDAVSLFEELWNDWPMEHRFGVRLAFCYQMLGQTQAQRQVVETLLERRRAEAKTARAKLKTFHELLRQRRRERGDGDGDGEIGSEQQLAETAQAEARDALTRDALKLPDAAANTAEAGAKPPLMSSKERVQYLNLRNLAQFSPYFMHYLMGNTCFNQGEYDQALEHLAKAEKADPQSTALHNLIGQIYLHMKQWQPATERFENVLMRDPENPDAYLGLTRIALSHRKNKKAARLALTTIGLRYQFPLAHYYLGVALERMGRPKRAARALEMALSQNPNLLEAHRRLEKLYSGRLGSHKAALRHSQAIAAIGEQMRAQRARRVCEPGEVDIGAEVPDIKPDAPTPEQPDAGMQRRPMTPQRPCTITIVSGLPRSGTSMMMQMLEAGGLPVLTDGKREADADNPKGYYELDAAKRLRVDRAWLPEADGKVVKLVAQLLPYLPPAPHHYRVVFMQRDLDEILTSQTLMLQRQGKQPARLPPEKLKSVFASQVQQIRAGLDQARGMEVLYMDYRKSIEDPEQAARQVDAFLGHGLDVQAMASVVQADLYRQRSTDNAAAPDALISTVVS